MKRSLALVAVLVTGLAVLGGSAVGAYGTGTKAATVKTRHTSLGTVLVDARGRTIYLFEKDRTKKSTCSGQCARNWPPVTTSGAPKAAGGAQSGKLGTTKRSDGTTQVTYNGHPLYLFVADQGKPGSTKGEGVKAFGAEWYVLGAGGKKVEEHGDDDSGDDHGDDG
jgi:predicted lipoprotein with Yx(FWY)xxD motif